MRESGQQTGKQSKKHLFHRGIPARTQVKLYVHTSLCLRCTVHPTCALALFHGENQPVVSIKRQSVLKGEALLFNDFPLCALCTVQRGSFKLCAPHKSGEAPQVTGFYLPGESFLVDGLQPGSHPRSAFALEDGEVCFMNMQCADWLNETVPASSVGRLVAVFTQQITQARLQSLLTVQRTSEERLGAFFLNLAERCGVDGVAKHAFHLPMLHMDIANYLDLTAETVSRVLRKFREQQWMEIEEGIVTITDIHRLRLVSKYRSERYGKKISSNDWS